MKSFYNPDRTILFDWGTCRISEEHLEEYKKMRTAVVLYNAFKPARWQIFYPYLLKPTYSANHETYEIFMRPTASDSEKGYRLVPNWNMVVKAIIVKGQNGSPIPSTLNWSECDLVARVYWKSRKAYLKKYLEVRSKRKSIQFAILY